MNLYHILFIKNKRKVSLAVLRWDDKILIVKRSEKEKNHAGKWGFPGGGIDEGETPLEAVMRECEEEIGVIPIDISELSENEHITWFIGDLPCDPAECVRLNWEHDAWALVDVDSMDDGYDMITGMRELIIKVLRGKQQ